MNFQRQKYNELIQKFDEKQELIHTELSRKFEEIKEKQEQIHSELTQKLDEQADVSLGIKERISMPS